MLALDRLTSPRARNPSLQYILPVTLSHSAIRAGPPFRSRCAPLKLSWLPMLAPAKRTSPEA